MEDSIIKSPPQHPHDDDDLFRNIEYSGMSIHSLKKRSAKRVLLDQNENQIDQKTWTEVKLNLKTIPRRLHSQSPKTQSADKSSSANIKPIPIKSRSSARLAAKSHTSPKKPPKESFVSPNINPKFKQKSPEPSRRSNRLKQKISKSLKRPPSITMRSKIYKSKRLKKE